MSLHEVNLQKLRRQHLNNGEEDGDTPPTPFIAFPSPTASNTMILAGALSSSRSDDVLSDNESVGVASQHTQKSWWADISEVDSMATSRKSVMMESDDDDSYQEEKKTDSMDDPRNYTPRTRHTSRVPLRDVAMPLRGIMRDDSSKGTTHQFVSEQSCGDSTVEEGSIASVQSGSGYSASSSHLNKMSSRQRYRYLMKQAQDQAEQARAELEIVQKQLATLEKRQLTEMDEIKRDIVTQQASHHKLRMEIKSTESEYKIVRDRLLEAVKDKNELSVALAEQHDAMNMQEKEHKATVQDLEAQLSAVKQAKATAEANLEEALEKIKALEEQIACQNLSSPSKNVRFAPPTDNQVVVFHSTDYASQLQASQNLNEELQQQLTELQHDMETLEDEHTSLKQMQRDASTDHQQALKVEKQAAQDARAQVRDLLKSLVDMQQSADRIEGERAKLQKELEHANGNRDEAEAKLAKKDKDMGRIEREVVKIQAAMASLQVMQDASFTPTPGKESLNGSSGEDLLYQLEKTRFRLEKQATTIEQERQTLQTTASDATSRFNKVNDQLFMIEMEKKELLQQLDGLKMQVSALREENSRLMAEKLAMEKALKEQQELMETSESRIHNLELERASLQEEVSTLQQRALDAESLRWVPNGGSDEELRQRLVSVQTTLASAEAKLAETREQLQEQVDLVHRLEAQLKALQHEIDVTKKGKTAMEETHAMAMEQQVQAKKEAEARVLEAQRQIEELQRLQDETQQQLAEEKSLLHNQVEQMSQQLFHVQVEKERLQDQLASMDAVVADHQEKAKSYADLDDVVVQRDRLQQQLDEKVSLVESLRTQLETQKNEVVELQDRTAELQAVEAALNEQVYSLRCDLDAANEALGVANSKIALLEQERTELQDSLSEAKESIQLLEERNKLLLEESAAMKQKYEKTISDLQAEHDDALSQLSTSREETQSLELSVDSLASSRDDLQSMVDEMESMRQERDNAVLAKVGLQKVNDELQDKVDAQSKKVKKLAKLLKRVIEKNSTPIGKIEMQEDEAVNGDGRVARMPIALKLRYRDKISGAMNKMEVSAEYSGPLIEGKPDGAGMLRFESGDIYLGEFKGGEMNGVGSYVRKRPPREGDSLCLSGIFANNSYVLPPSPSSSNSSF